MKQITGAIIGITLVLIAVFVPMAFFPGSVGIIYRQFSMTMIAAILFSALLALSLTPALCATCSSRSKPGIRTRARACSAGSTAAWSRPRTATAGSCNGRSCGLADSCSSTLVLIVGSAVHSCGCQAASFRSRTKASSPLTCRRQPRPRSTAHAGGRQKREDYLLSAPGVEG